MPLPPFDDRPGKIWFNGALVPWPEATLHALSHGLHFASAVFEGIRVYGGVPFRLEQHTTRLLRSAQLVDFEIPFTEYQINDACRELVRVQNIDDGYIRPVSWRGSEFMAPAAIGALINTAIATWEWPIYYSPEARMEGIRLKIAEWRRPAPNMAPTQAKASGLYQICTLAKNDAERCGYDDALMYDYRGFIAETTSSNVFFVIDGELQTPIADCFLDGITRQAVIEIAERLNIKVVETHLKPEDLTRADEAFITGTAAEITPVREIGEYTFTPSSMTEVLMEAFDAEVRSSADGEPPLVWKTGAK
jgi:branched-chain amino acid aminotransferase